MRDNTRDAGFPSHGVFRAARDAVIVMDADGLVRGWNPAAEGLFGYDQAEAVGRDLAELVIRGRSGQRIATPSSAT